MRGEVGESRGKRNHNQDILCERGKKAIFNKRKKNDNIWELDKNIISLPSDAG